MQASGHLASTDETLAVPLTWTENLPRSANVLHGAFGQVVRGRCETLIAAAEGDRSGWRQIARLKIEAWPAA